MAPGARRHKALRHQALEADDRMIRAYWGRACVGELAGPLVARATLVAASC